MIFFIWSKDDPDQFSFLAGFTEETLKFLAIYLFLKDRIEFNEPMDAIVYGTLISLGFATFENFEYVYIYNYPLTSIEVAVMRSLSAIPLHAACGITMGYFFALYLFRGSRIFLLKSLCYPIMIHAIYNHSLNYSFIITILILVVILFLSYFLHHSFVEAQKLKISEKEDKVV